MRHMLYDYQTVTADTVRDEVAAAVARAESYAVNAPPSWKNGSDM